MGNGGQSNHAVTTLAMVSFPGYRLAASLGILTAAFDALVPHSGIQMNS